MNKRYLIDELIDILEKVQANITDESDMVWTQYNTPKELWDELDTYIRELKDGSTMGIKRIYMLFLPTATLQEHSMSNGWADEYLKLSERFDELYSNDK